MQAANAVMKQGVYVRDFFFRCLALPVQWETDGVIFRNPAKRSGSLLPLKRLKWCYPGRQLCLLFLQRIPGVIRSGSGMEVCFRAVSFGRWTVCLVWSGPRIQRRKMIIRWERGRGRCGGREKKGGVGGGTRTGVEYSMSVGLFILSGGKYRRVRGRVRKDWFWFAFG